VKKKEEKQNQKALRTEEGRKLMGQQQPARTKKDYRKSIIEKNEE